MKPLLNILDERVRDALIQVTKERECNAIIRVSADPKFGDYQANGIMAAAKKMKTNPRKLAEQVVSELDVSDICQEPEIAGPGFINFRLKPEFISQSLMDMAGDPKRLGINKVDDKKTVVVDFSGPNIAKQMHVGHLRSTIIGDSICRILEFLGHAVIRQNHIGDWGTQFGMLIAYLKEAYPDVIDQPDTVQITDLESFYRNAKKRCDEDASFAEHARQEVVRLHNHDKHTMRVWQHIVDESRKHYQPIYDQLNVSLHQENEQGESFYRDRLGEIVETLKTNGIAVESDGAYCVFPEGFKNKEGNPLPFIIQKSDGAFLYATTDLAAMKYRVDELKADCIIYVTDSRQKLHFEMLFATAKLANWASESIDLKHIMFGSVLGEDGKPFKTRSGENVKLSNLLDESIQKAAGIVEEKNPNLSRTEKETIAHAVGIGAIKYADYSNNRTSDYIFSFDKMLAMDGNTAPYMQYAYARVRSIERKAEEKQVDIAKELSDLQNADLTEPEELELAKHIIRYGQAIEAAASDFRINYLTSYLYDLAQKFSGFYNNCPVLGCDKTKRPTRILLCDLTAGIIRHGLSELLGIEVPQQM